MDQSSLHFFMACGVPPWRELEKTRGIVGTPLLEIQTKFIASATYGETLDIETQVETWNRKTFLQRHVVRRGDTVICEGTELRVFVVRDPDNRDRLRSIEVPADIRIACGG
jgi:4-hydroxybenzoyl-CoA thioesterase